MRAVAAFARTGNGCLVLTGSALSEVHRELIVTLAARHKLPAIYCRRYWHQGPSIMGFEDEAEQSIRRPCRQTNGRSKRTCELTSSIVPRGHHSTAEWNSSFLLLDLMLHGFHAAAVACSRVQRNSVPSTHMRCMITASRRARATIAFFIPRRLAICIAQALSQDHFFERSML